MPRTAKARWLITVIVALCMVVGTLVWWSKRDAAPYALRDTPEVHLTVRAATSAYPEAQEVAREAELLLEVYVQRLQDGDAEELADIGAPWYTGREAAARDLIAKYGAQAGDPVQAVVADPVTPGLASVELRYGSESRQTLDLTRDGGVWWLAIGNGDPVKP
ncbi:hypothetical protein GCM10010261_59950 [Streptomyces pilosus]|uniref:hypothetical protein n=1 Tax=Streptomyces pilosus TaxID=28893 RepID=UPI0016727E6B|nr:hypothetical protein [Streptomyces pilosus]GGV67175.1 hypothetical protein GCM10010261_59950 [Streptomyces pilosus]